MFYRNLKFPKIKNRPFFYTNFVQTVDGKVQVLKNTKDYWPIGSKLDHEALLELRAYSDCLIHGSNLAKEFGSQDGYKFVNAVLNAMVKSSNLDRKPPV